jgi:hypothetical protein
MGVLPMPPQDKDKSDDLEEDGYVKADKRASHEADEERPEEAAPEEPTTEPPPTEEGERPDINVHSLLRMTVGMFIEQAWIHLGLRMDPNKNKVEQNLPHAKTAIDIVEFMIQKLGPDLDEGEKRELDLMLANLRMNYVQRA